MMGMGNMMKQARQMQQRMAEVQKEVGQLERSFTVADAIKVTARGDNTIVRIEISPAAVDGGDVESLEDLLLTGVNGALREVQEAAKSKMSEVTGGMDLSQFGL